MASEVRLGVKRGPCLYFVHLRLQVCYTVMSCLDFGICPTVVLSASVLGLSGSLFVGIGFIAVSDDTGVYDPSFLCLLSYSGFYGIVASYCDMISFA